MKIPQIPQSKPIFILALGILGEDVLKLLGDEPAFRIVGARVGAMLRLLDVADVDTEERVRQEGELGWVGERAVDDEHGENGEENGEAQAVEAAESI